MEKDAIKKLQKIEAEKLKAKPPNFKTLTYKVTGTAPYIGNRLTRKTKGDN